MSMAEAYLMPCLVARIVYRYTSVLNSIQYTVIDMHSAVVDVKDSQRNAPVWARAYGFSQSYTVSSSTAKGHPTGTTSHRLAVLCTGQARAAVMVQKELVSMHTYN